jgi:hypothetical protein
MNTDHAADQSNPARDEQGRFKSGNRGGPGNPFARQVAALRQAILERLTPQDIQDIVSSLINLAKEGNFQAAKLLFAYGIGKPQPAPEPDRMDADEQDVAAGIQEEMAPRPQEEDFEEEEPSGNGVDGHANPSPNRDNGKPTVAGMQAPLPNRKQRRAQRKRERAQRKRERANPSPNGKLTPEQRFAISG